MTLAEAAEISRRAHLHLGAGGYSCFITAQTLADLADAYVDAKRRLDMIAAITPGARAELADHHQDEVRDALEEIEWFA